MFQQILIGAALVGATVIIQAGFMLVGLRALEWLRTAERTFSHHHATFVIVSFVLFMFLAVVIDVWIWALVYWKLGAITSFEEALYFSTTSFTTIGYGDVVLTRDWRLLSAFEGANGMIIFGWTTALVIAVIQRFYSWHHK
ncbi:MAG: potassium channel family protein [Pseudomonadota bacterium]